MTFNESDKRLLWIGGLVGAVDAAMFDWLVVHALTNFPNALVNPPLLDWVVKYAFGVFAFLLLTWIWLSAVPYLMRLSDFYDQDVTVSLRKLRKRIK
jgi:hypothetical protein